MANIDLFRRRNLTEVARHLEVHPFDLARYLGANKQLPPRLQLDAEAVEQLESELGIRTVWAEEGPQVHEPNPRRRLLRELAGRLLDANFTHSHRADNWYRGLVEEQQVLITRAVNLMIELDLLQSASTPAGLHIRVNEAAREQIELIFSGSDIPDVFNELWGV
jgi:hypothetical protein